MFVSCRVTCCFFFFNDTATTEIYTLSLHDALPISAGDDLAHPRAGPLLLLLAQEPQRSEEHTSELQSHSDLVCRLLLEKKKVNRLEGARLGRSKGGGAATGRCCLHPRGPLRGRAVHAGAARRPGDARRFFCNDTATTEIYTLSLHDALPI